MSALPAIPSPLRSISSHAIERYQQRVLSVPRGVARVGVFRLYTSGYDATEYQKARLGTFDGETSLRIVDTCYGCFALIVKRGVVVTLYKVWL